MLSHFLKSLVLGLCAIGTAAPLTHADSFLQCVEPRTAYAPRFNEAKQNLSGLSNSEAKKILHRLSGDDFVSYLGFIPSVNVRSDPSPNAFAIRGGMIVLSSGLLGLLDSEDELAFVLAHELSHMLLQHRELHGNGKFEAFLSRTEQTQPDVQRELDADHLALKLLSLAGYNALAPHALLTRIALLSLQADGGAVSPNLQAILKRAQALRAAEGAA